MKNIDQLLTIISLKITRYLKRFIRLEALFRQNVTKILLLFEIDSAGTNVFLINNGVGLDANSEERINDVGNIERFNFESTLSYWSNKYANMINGTDSTLWHPDVSKTERLYAFFSDICRSVYLEFDETYDNRFSIKAYRYKIPNSVFASSSTNKGFCLNTTTANKSNAYECLSNGLFSLKTCIHRKLMNSNVKYSILKLCSIQ